MRYLLDVNVLLALLWKDHPHHQRALDRLEHEPLAICPIGELGFLRVSTNPRVFKASMEKARELLADFLKNWDVARYADDLPALEQNAKTSDEVTDQYLASLAEKHGLKFATLDEGIEHSAAEVI